jgi:hypothetical protein
MAWRGVKVGRNGKRLSNDHVSGPLFSDLRLRLRLIAMFRAWLLVCVVCEGVL